jgi:hypothetical protein
MFSSKEFAKICTPAKIYFAITMLSIFFSLFNGFSVMTIIGQLLFAFIYTFILSWLCKIGLSALSWFLVLLPYVLALLMLFGIYNVGKTLNL